MSRKCSAQSARRLVNTYKNQIEKQINKIQKNFEDMDFENADARNEMENIVNRMKSECRSLINALDAYYFS